MREEIDLVRDVLDKQIVDRDETKMGRVDGLVLVVSGDGPPRVDRLEMGFAVLARRIHPRVEWWFRTFRRRWSIRRVARYSVPWPAIIDITAHHVQLDLKALETPALAWERWLRDHVVARIPGSGGQ